ncbi:MAG: TonB-dependent receptor [Massilia sp.]
MRKYASKEIRINRLSYAVSIAVASLIAGNSAMAQEAPAPAAKAPADEVQTVLVIGARASQQSSIARKKNAATAIDSIIAEDVGAFPDRNVGEAISRVAGIALDRGDFGEGVSVTVRGNGPDLTRVEIDGQGVQAGGGSNLSGGGDGRGVELRELSSDLIKSVDVVKGNTADMTEGSLGGGIIIKTRTGLDFKKPFYSARISASQGSLNKQVSPNLNLVLSNKFLDDRLGIIVNLGKSNAFNENHIISQGGGSNQQGLIRSIDFDNSPEKTFSFNPALVNQSDPSINVSQRKTPALAAGPGTTLDTDGKNYFIFSTPLELITKSAAAKSKQACYDMFTPLTRAQINNINGSDSAQKVPTIQLRTNELTTCLNQWNDYTPPTVRYGVHRQTDDRLTGDVRLDFKVNNKLSVYSKFSRTRRELEDWTGTFGYGTLSTNPTSVTGNPNYVVGGPAFVDNETDQTRAAVAGSGYFLYPGWSFRSSTTNAGAMPVSGIVANVDPASVKVDATHHVTSFTMSDALAGTDQTHSRISTSNQYFNLGGSYRDGGLKMEFFAGSARSDLERMDLRVSISNVAGPTTLSIAPSGIWNYTLPAGSTYNQLNYPSYANLSSQAAAGAVAAGVNANVASPVYTAAQRPLVGPSTQLVLQSPRANETLENTAKWDMTYALNDRLPYLTNLKAGVNWRDTSGKSWGGGATTVSEPSGTFGKADYVPGVYLPGPAAFRSTVQACQDTPGSLAPGGQRCVYGYSPSNDPRNSNGRLVLTQQQYIDLVAQTLVVPPNTQFYQGAPGRSDQLTNGWTIIDIEKFFNLTSAVPGYNLDCIKYCTASDGKVYAQQYGSFDEKVKSGYLMTDFTIDHLPFTKRALPFGLELEGNFGYRMVSNNVHGSGYLTYSTVVPNADYDYQINPNSKVTYSVSRPVSIASDTTDIMPSFNLATWLISDKLVLRYNRGKTVARPGVSKLLPSGTCTNDLTKLRSDYPKDSDGSDADMTCNRTFGNPALKPQTNINQNLSLEWYPNKDSSVSFAVFKQDGKIGAPNGLETITNGLILGGTDASDPLGNALNTIPFTYTRWTNLPASVRTGFESSFKTAFTFLPWFFKYTGFDGNYTRAKSKGDGALYFDLLTGTLLPPPGESKYSYNASLWYDDGALSARVALQVATPTFSCIAGCGATTVNNYPNIAGGNQRIPYNPGSPIFKDMTRYVDAKIAYKFKNGVEIFAEGRNLGNFATSTSTGGFNDYADGTPNMLTNSYNGRRFLVGVNIRSLQ